jgi:flagellin
MIIQHNIVANHTMRQLTINKQNTSKATQCLSSGYRINKAADDAAGLSMSEKLRNQIRGLNRAARNIEEGISMVQTGDGGMSEAHEILKRMRELAVQSANGVNTDEDREAIQHEIDQLTDEIDAISKGTEYNTIGILNSDDWPVADAAVSTVTTVPINSQYANSTYSYTYVRKGTENKVRTETRQNDIPARSSDDYEIEHTQESIPDFTMEDWTSEGFPDKKTYNEKTIETKTTTTTDAITNRIKDINVIQPASTLDIAIGSNGSPRFLTEEANAFNLQGSNMGLTLRIGGSPVTDVNLYRDSNVTRVGPTYDASGKKSVFTYTYGNYEIRQTISVIKTDPDDPLDPSDSVSNDDRFDIQYAITDKYPSDNKPLIMLKYTLDAMNGYTSYTTHNTGSDTDVYTPISNDKSTYANFWALHQSKDVQVKFQDYPTGRERVTMSSAPQTGGDFLDPALMVLDNIQALTPGWNWDPTVQDPVYTNGTKAPSNSAIGYYWEFDLNENTPTLKAGCTYDAKFSVDVYKNTNDPYNTTITGNIVTTETRHDLTYDNKTQIQAGANEGQIIKIPLLDTSARMLEVENISILTPEDSTEAIGKIDIASAFISKLRGNWGAKQNRLEHAVANLDNTSENLQTAESAIRDTDMAKAMVNYSKNNILAQAGQSILAQANQSTQGVLSLLS